MLQLSQLLRLRNKLAHRQAAAASRKLLFANPTLSPRHTYDSRKCELLVSIHSATNTVNSVLSPMLLRLQFRYIDWHVRR